MPEKKYAYVVRNKEGVYRACVSTPDMMKQLEKDSGLKLIALTGSRKTAVRFAEIANADDTLEAWRYLSLVEPKTMNARFV